MPLDFEKIATMNDKLNPSETSTLKNNLAKLKSGDIDTGLPNDQEIKNIANQIPDSVVNRAVAGLSNAISDPICDYKCQKEKEKKRRLNELRFIGAIKDFIPKYENEVEKRYYAITQEDDPYREWKKEQVNKDVNEDSNKLLTNHDSSYKNLMIDLNNYTSHFTYLDNMKTLKTTYSDLNNEMNEDIDKLKTVKNTSFRKAEYEQGYSENYVRLNNFLYKFYWGAILFFILYFILLKKQYSNLGLWLKVLIMGLLPFAISYLHYLIRVVVQYSLPYIGM